MTVELMIYLFLFVLVSMILFNVACIFVFSVQDKRINKTNDRLTELIHKKMETGADEFHQKYMYRKLKSIDALQAFDLALERLEKEDKEGVRRYLESLTPVLIDLTQVYLKKEELQAAYFPYIIRKYNLFYLTKNRTVLSTLLELVRRSSLYSRENALEALYSIGNVEALLQALKIINDSDYYHNDKLLCDGLLTFQGNKQELDNSLWQQFRFFNEDMQLVILEYFRFGNDGDKYLEQVFDVMTACKRNSELFYSCLRFFGKYPYYEAYRQMLQVLSDEDSNGFECRTIIAGVLGSYDYPEVRDVLIHMLHDRNWYVRNNAASSLRKLGVDYFDLIEIFEGDDRYAREVAAYFLKRSQNKENVNVDKG